MASSWIVLLLFFSFASIPFTQANLTFDYYAKTCPKFEETVNEITQKKQQEHGATAGTTIRLFFNDCAVNGCDASILIKPNPFNKTEIEHEINYNLGGDGAILVARIKTALELTCPGVVSCSDILAAATRKLVTMVGGPDYKVPLGRKDGRVSLATNIEGKIARPNDTVDQMIQKFEAMGFNIQEMVVFVGGRHSIGFVHCKEFADRIYGKPDPTMNPKLLETLKTQCANYAANPSLAASHDVMTPEILDNMLFKNIMNGMGVLGSDQALFNDPRTKPFVEKYANDALAFSADFARAMEKLNAYQVKIGDQGEVRRRCDAPN